MQEHDSWTKYISPVMQVIGTALLLPLKESLENTLILCSRY